MFFPYKTCSKVVYCLRSIEETAPPSEPVSDTARLHPFAWSPEQATLMNDMMVLILVISLDKQYSDMSVVGSSPASPQSLCY
jgi:hypothetical protein